MAYDELIERLRHDSESRALMLEAADAIEELSMKFLGDEAAIAGMKREIERMVVAGKAIPAADVAEVRPGRWIKDGKDGPVYCSECGEEHEWGDYRARYCDTCGAKMSWEREDDE